MGSEVAMRRGRRIDLRGSGTLAERQPLLGLTGICMAIVFLRRLRLLGIFDPLGELAASRKT
jgi:hypothetical protein